MYMYNIYIIYIYIYTYIHTCNYRPDRSLAAAHTGRSP